MRSVLKKHKGFVLVEILISGVIIVSSIAASLYLMRLGLNHIDKIETNNKISSVIPIILNQFEIMTVDDLRSGKGSFNLDDDFRVTWESKVEFSKRPERDGFEGKFLSMYEYYLFNVNFELHYKDVIENKNIKILKYEKKVEESEF